MRTPWPLVCSLFVLAIILSSSHAQDYDYGKSGGATPLGGGGASSDTTSNSVPGTGGGSVPGTSGGSTDSGTDGSTNTTAVSPPIKGQDDCNGIFVAYTFTSREKAYPMVKNVTAQAWSFKSQLTVLNGGTEELKAWRVYVGFQHNEILVTAENAMISEDLPAKVGNNGTTFMGYPAADLKTAIDTAGDLKQMQSLVTMTGTQFGLKDGAPLPKTLRLENDGYKCPAPKKEGSQLQMCCTKDSKYKAVDKNKFMARQKGDLSLTYDVLKALEGNYMAQVTIDNVHPLGRLDHWNLTWEWMRGEFILNMRGAYTRKKGADDCIYGPQGKYYTTLDFATVMNCERKPIISDLPKDKADDEKIGKLPSCCRNGTVLPATMNPTKAKSIFQLTVYKMPPDVQRTVLYPPQKWKINGILNPEYKCGAPIRVKPSEFPDPLGLSAKISAIASWQVTCNITAPKPKENKCCVSFSAYYSESAIPCNTCACGCPTDKYCDKNAHALLLPPNALLVPFANRTAQAKAWATLKHLPYPDPSPCPDNCGVSINWHVDTDFASGWTARMTIFNWGAENYEDWFAAITMKKAQVGFENVYSFNGTKLDKPNDTIFFRGKEGLEFLLGATNNSKSNRPRVPGKQQSVMSFLKKRTPNIDVANGDGFPNKLYFNGEECALPVKFPSKSGAHGSSVGYFSTIVFGIVTAYFLVVDRPL